jgi:hypothetical protein
MESVYDGSAWVSNKKSNEVGLRETDQAVTPFRIEHPMSEPERINHRQLLPGPIRHKSLPPELLERINEVFDLIGPYIKMTLEQFEVGFMRDLHPEREGALWCSIAAAWFDYHEKFLGGKELAVEEERKLLASLISISTGVEDLGKLGVPVEVGRRLLACYEGLADD